MSPEIANAAKGLGKAASKAASKASEYVKTARIDNDGRVVYKRVGSSGDYVRRKDSTGAIVYNKCTAAGAKAQGASASKAKRGGADGGGLGFKQINNKFLEKVRNMFSRGTAMCRNGEKDLNVNGACIKRVVLVANEKHVANGRLLTEMGALTEQLRSIGSNVSGELLNTLDELYASLYDDPDFGPIVKVWNEKFPVKENLGDKYENEINIFQKEYLGGIEIKYNIKNIDTGNSETVKSDKPLHYVIKHSAKIANPNSQNFQFKRIELISPFEIEADFDPMLTYRYN